MAFSKDKAHDRAEKYAARGQHDRAAREYQAIVEHDPKDVRAWLMLADSLARTGDRAGAVGRYQQVGDFYASGGELQKALAVYRQVLNLDPSRLDIHYKCAQLNMDVGRVHDAIASFESIAQSQLQTGRVAEALQTYRTIADADPSVVSKRLRLAELYSRERMVDEAVDAFRQAADFLLEAGRHADYVRVAERLVYHKPDDRETIRALARVYLHLGDARRALMKLNGLLQADPSDAAGLELLAETFMSLGKPDKARSVVIELIKKLQEAGDDIGAGRALEMGLQWTPNDPELLALRSRAALPTVAPDPASVVTDDPFQGLELPAPGEDVDAGSPHPESPVQEQEQELVLDDGDVMELDDGDFVLEGSSADEIDFSGVGSEVDFDAAAEAPADTSTPMTEHVLEEVSQHEVRTQSAAVEAVDISSLTDGDKVLFEARVYVKYRLFEHALEHLDPLLRDTPQNVAALSLRARSLTELDRADEAASTHARIAGLVAAGDPKLAREHVQAALKVSPGHRDALAVQAALERADAPQDEVIELDDDVELLDDDDIAIEVAELEPELELEPEPLVVENRFGISEAGPLPDPDPHAPSGGISLSIAPTEQMASLQRARGERTPQNAFVPRQPTAEMDRGEAPERAATSVDIAADSLESDGVPRVGMNDFLDLDDDTSPLELDVPGGLGESPAPPASVAEAEEDFDAEFEAAFEDGFDELLDMNAPKLGADSGPVPAPHSAAPSVPAAKSAPAGGWADLSDDLAEIRFYVDQGLDDDASAALTELGRSHPGHPEIAKMQADLSGAQAPPPTRSAGATPLVDLNEDADEDAYLSAIFDDGPGTTSTPKPVKSVGVSAKAQDVAGAGARDRFDLGMAYREMGLVDSAVTEFEAACTDPEWESRARVMLGTLRALQGNVELAVSDLRRAAEVAGTDEERSSAHYELAVLFEKTGDSAAAVELLQGIAAGFRERDQKLAALQG